MLPPHLTHGRDFSTAQSGTSQTTVSNARSRHFRDNVSEARSRGATALLSRCGARRQRCPRGRYRSERYP